LSVGSQTIRARQQLALDAAPNSKGSFTQDAPHGTKRHRKATRCIRCELTLSTYRQLQERLDDFLKRARKFAFCDANCNMAKLPVLDKADAF